MKIFLDIETVPLGEEPLYTKPPEFVPKVPANYKNPTTIAKYIEENRDLQLITHLNEHAAKHLAALEEFKKGALKATRSQIVCICAIDSIGSKFQMSHIDENWLLTEFGSWLSYVGADCYVGHNVKFDLQMIRTHASKHMAHKLVDRMTFEKWSKNIVDTMELWAGVRYDDKTKLTEIAEFLGIKDLNEGTTGADVYDLYKAGKFDEIETKCMNDVLMCKEVYERIS